MEKPILAVKNLKIEINNQLILNNVSFDVKKQETVAIIGPNGAGKTVLFKALLGLIPYQGIIDWQKGIKIGYVPQKIFVESDLPLTVEEFFSLKRTSPTKIQMDDLLSSVGFRRHKITRQRLGVLSGGQLQRVMIAWAMSGNPNVLLFDEPTAGIDVSSEETIYSLLHHLQKVHHLTILLISHELEIVYQYANNVVCLNKNALCFGPPRQVLDSKNLAELFGGEVGLYHHH